MAFHTTLFGFVLVMAPTLFDQPSWSGFRDTGVSEGVLGWVMFVLGVARIVGLIVNGSRKHVTPLIRQVSAGVDVHAVLQAGWLADISRDCVACGICHANAPSQNAEAVLIGLTDQGLMAGNFHSDVEVNGGVHCCHHALPAIGKSPSGNSRQDA